MKKNRSHDFYQALPKAELHVHLDGSIRPETVLELAEQAGVSKQIDSIQDVRDAVQPPTEQPSLEKYLKAFDLLCSVLHSPEALHRVTTELLEDLHQDGVLYTEIRYSPRVLPRDVDTDLAIEAVGDAIRQAEQTLGIYANQILCVMRHEPPEHGLEVAKQAVAHRNSRVVALDIAGGEAHNPPAPHRAAFDYAQSHYLHATVHAGEAGPSTYIRDAVVSLGAERIGHATHLPDDPELMAYLAERRICVEACISSNEQTGAVASSREHPLPAFLEADLPVTLCTDNTTVSNIFPSEEYRLADKIFSLSDQQLRRLSLDGFRYAFAPIEIRQKVTKEASRQLDELLKS